MESERFNRGWEKLKEIDDEAGKKVIESLKEISPDLGRFIIEYSFGDIYSRDGLDLKSKENCGSRCTYSLGQCPTATEGSSQRSAQYRKLCR